MSNSSSNNPNSAQVTTGNLNNAGSQADFGPSKGVWVLLVFFLGLAVTLALFGGLFNNGKVAIVPTQIEATEKPTDLSNGETASVSKPPPKVSINQQMQTNEAVNIKQWAKFIASGKKAFLDGEYEVAEERFGKAVEVSKKLKGSDHLVTTLNNLAAVYQVEKKYQPAESLYKEAIDLLKKDGSVSQTSVNQVLKNYGNLLRGTGRTSEAAWLKHEADWIVGRPVLL